MKTVMAIILFATLFSSNSSFAGKTLICNAVGKILSSDNAPEMSSDGKPEISINDQLGPKEKVAANCEDKTGAPYKVIIDGVGLGFHSGHGSFVLACPTVRKKKFDQGFVMGGIKANAGVLIVADLGIAINPIGGFCILTGLEFGLGASFSINKMEIAPGKITAQEAKW